VEHSPGRGVLVRDVLGGGLTTGKRLSDGHPSGLDPLGFADEPASRPD